MVFCFFFLSFLFFKSGLCTFHHYVSNSTAHMETVIDEILDRDIPNKHFALFLDCHGVLTNNPNPDSFSLFSLKARGHMMPWVKSMREKRPSLPIKIISAWHEPEKVRQDIEAIGLKECFEWQEAHTQQTTSYIAQVHGDYIFIRDVESKEIYFRGKGYGPDVLSQEQSLTDVIFVDDTFCNITLFKKQCEKSRCYQNLQTIHLIHLSGYAPFDTSGNIGLAHTSLASPDRDTPQTPERCASISPSFDDGTGFFLNDFWTNTSLRSPLSTPCRSDLTRSNDGDFD